MGQSSTAKKAGPGDAARKVAQQRLSVPELARELGTVAEACRQRGMNRTSFYEWKRRFQTQGLGGLKDLAPIYKSPLQTTPPEVVEKIKGLALAHPAYGCNRHEALLALEGIRVSAITIQKILNEIGLGIRIDRWLALEQQNAKRATEITPEQAAFLEKLNPCFREGHGETSTLGELLSADTFFVGSLKGVGKVYLDLNGFEYRRTKVKSSKANGFVERFNRTVLDEVFRVKMRETFYETVEALQGDLDAWLIDYNTDRPHLGYRNQGRRPIETVMPFVSQEG